MLRFKKEKRWRSTHDSPVIINWCTNHITNTQKNCIFLRFMFSVGICCKVHCLLFSFYSTWPEEMSLFWRGVIYPLSKNWQSSLIRLTLLNSIYKTESSDLVHNLTDIYQEEKSPQQRAGSEHSTAQHRHLVQNTEKNRQKISYPSIATSKYS